MLHRAARPSHLSGHRSFVCQTAALHRPTFAQQGSSSVAGQPQPQQRGLAPSSAPYPGGQQQHTASRARTCTSATPSKKQPKMALQGASNTIRGELSELFKTALAAAYPAFPSESPILVPCNNPKFGDYQCNNAMGLHGKLKGTEGAPKAPRDVATAILAAVPPNPILKETSLAGPGFINLKVSRDYIAGKINHMLVDGASTWAPKIACSRAVVDFSSPNVAKEMHVGHLRSTIIGDTIARTLEFCGVDVLRLNHIGDWGTQFGMLIQHMSEVGGSDEDVSDLMALYRAAKERFDKEEDFKTRAREAVKELQSGNPTSIKAWQRICAASRKEFGAIYERLGVQLQERGESYYNPMLKDVVTQMKEQGVAVESDGAQCVFIEGAPAPLIVQKSDGGFGYASTDMAALRQRIFEEKADWIIYVVDVGQSGHFDMVFAAAKKMGWLPDTKPRVDHVGFGLVLGDDGKRFRTRSGDLVRLVELLDEAKRRCADNIRARKEEMGEEVVPEEIEASSIAMGYGAVKYADLKNNRLTNYKFSFDEMLNLKGNTAVYLLYAHARIAGIVRKADKDVVELAKTKKVVLGHPKEEELALHIVKFPEAVEDMLQELLPNRLCDYLYDLSEKFNGFYVDCKVVGNEHEDSRLLLCEATAVIMRQCFSLLGITPLYRI